MADSFVQRRQWKSCPLSRSSCLLPLAGGSVLGSSAGGTQWVRLRGSSGDLPVCSRERLVIHGITGGWTECSHASFLDSSACSNNPHGGSHLRPSSTGTTEATAWRLVGMVRLSLTKQPL